MLLTKKSACLAVTSLLFVGACNKTDTPAPAPATSSPSAAVPSSPAPSGTAAATAVTEVAGTYNAVSGVTDQPIAKRHQTLILHADGTAELDTKVFKTPAATTPETSDVGTGSFTAGPKEVAVTFTLKDGKPLPASDTMRSIKLTRDPGGKALTGDDGRTFERAK